MQEAVFLLKVNHGPGIFLSTYIPLGSTPSQEQNRIQGNEGRNLVV